MLFFNLFTNEISIYKMVVNLQMTKEHLTHKHWSHIVPVSERGEWGWRKMESLNK